MGLLCQVHTFCCIFVLFLSPAWVFIHEFMFTCSWPIHRQREQNFYSKNIYTYIYQLAGLGMVYVPIFSEYFFSLWNGGEGLSLQSSPNIRPNRNPSFLSIYLCISTILPSWILLCMYNVESYLLLTRICDKAPASIFVLSFVENRAHAFTTAVTIQSSSMDCWCCGLRTKRSSNNTLGGSTYRLFCRIPHARVFAFDILETSSPCLRVPMPAACCLFASASPVCLLPRLQ